MDNLLSRHQITSYQKCLPSQRNILLLKCNPLIEAQQNKYLRPGSQPTLWHCCRKPLTSFQQHLHAGPIRATQGSRPNTISSWICSWLHLHCRLTSSHQGDSLNVNKGHTHKQRRQHDLMPISPHYPQIRNILQLTDTPLWHPPRPRQKHKNSWSIVLAMTNGNFVQMATW